MSREKHPTPATKEEMLSAARNAGLLVDKLVYMQEERSAVSPGRPLRLDMGDCGPGAVLRPLDCTGTRVE
ncbi:MAG: hypothetical protein ACKVQA_13050 [Burkholderiales bacterium]